jgi:hypothetical protein
MPIHDWRRVSAGTFHDFHGAWIIHLKETLNSGLLPDGFYAMSEQHGGQIIADVLTLQVGDPAPPVTPGERSLALVEVPPRVSRKAVTSPQKAARALRRTLAIRHTSTHRIVALLEVLSPANKDRAASVAEFVRKAQSAINLGCHVLMVDLFPPGRSDPDGMHAAIWDAFGDDLTAPPEDKPLTLASYLAIQLPVAYYEFVAVGDSLPEMPLFLDRDWYVNVPLEATYMMAYRGMPAFWRGVIEGTGEAEQR